MRFEALVVENEQQRAAAWELFYFNTEAAQALVKVADKERLATILNIGMAWQGSTNWPTTKVARKVYTLTNMAILESDHQQYLHGFLLSMAIAAGIEAPQELLVGEKMQTAAFVLADLWTGNPEPTAGTSADI